VGGVSGSASAMQSSAAPRLELAIGFLRALSAVSRGWWRWGAASLDSRPRHSRTS